MRLDPTTAAFAGLGVAAAALAAGAAEPTQPGAYCPLPKQGETPTCLEPAQAEYGDFFAALGQDEVDEEGLGRVERDLSAGAGSERAYLALSSLAYGYWQLSERAARREGEGDSAEISARLERWNAVLGRAYDASEGDETFRAALREAALDLQRRAPPVRVSCLDERGVETQCDSTDVVVRGLDAAASDVGLRGGLRRLIERIVGSDDS